MAGFLSPSPCCIAPAQEIYKFCYGVPWFIDEVPPPPHSEGGPDLSAVDGPVAVYRADCDWDAAEKLVKARAETARQRRWPRAATATGASTTTTNDRNHDDGDDDKGDVDGGDDDGSRLPKVTSEKSEKGFLDR